ncbi:MAG: L-threonylcarbamoyladenylate synthase [Planctomycetota bacterium]
MPTPLVLPALVDGHVDPQAIERAAECLTAGGLVAVPTETVYGLAARADDPRAVERIYTAKGRPAHNPLIVHLPGVEQARSIAAEWSDAAAALARAFWPGPLTLVVPRADPALASVSAGRASIALRVPDHPVLLAVLESCGLPLAAPSANRSNAVSPTRAEHVVASLGANVDLVLDAGPCRVGIESSVVDVTGDPPRLLRPGGLSLERLREAAPTLTAVADPRSTLGGHAAPGLDSKHYAPRARLHLMTRAELEGLCMTPAPGHVRGLLTLEPLASQMAWSRALGSDPAHYASQLYAALHDADAADCGDLFVESPPSDSRWMAVADRLRRARSRGTLSTD